MPPVDLKARIDALKRGRLRGDHMTPHVDGEWVRYADLAALLIGEEPPADQREAIIARCSSFLGNGGFFNPEMMEQRKATQLILDCRDFLLAASPRVGAPMIGQCKYCHRGVPLAWLDADGSFSHLSGRPSTLCHHVGDSWWPCERVGAEPSPERHANAIPLWTCDCPCHSRTQDDEDAGDWDPRGGDLG